MSKITLIDLVFHQQSRELEVVLSDERRVRLSYELLRVNTPSAEARGHSPADAIVQTGCRHVGIDHIAHVGNYAIQPHFDDGHNTGIYSWDYLVDLAIEKDRYWRNYLDALMEKGVNRDDPMTAPNNKHHH